jgi:AcrR family transcriptional regulator
MVRPRALNDDELLARIVGALEQRTETSAWSLSDVAPAAGMSPAGLIKRFGSKSGLLRALTRRWVESIPQEAPVSGADARVALAEYVAAEFGAESAAGAVFALSEVLDELRDPELAELLAEGWSRQAHRLAVLLDAMDLPRLSDPEVGGLLLLDALHGALFRSAVGSGRASPLFTLDRFLEIWT